MNIYKAKSIHGKNVDGQYVEKLGRHFIIHQESLTPFRIRQTYFYEEEIDPSTLEIVKLDLNYTQKLVLLERIRELLLSCQTDIIYLGRGGTPFEREIAAKELNRRVKECSELLKGI